MRRLDLVHLPEPTRLIASGPVIAEGGIRCLISPSSGRLRVTAKTVCLGSWPEAAGPSRGDEHAQVIMSTAFQRRAGRETLPPHERGGGGGGEIGEPRATPRFLPVPRGEPNERDESGRAYLSRSKRVTGCEREGDFLPQCAGQGSSARTPRATGKAAWVSVRRRSRVRWPDVGLRLLGVARATEGRRLSSRCTWPPSRPKRSPVVGPPTSVSRPREWPDGRSASVDHDALAADVRGEW